MTPRMSSLRLYPPTILQRSNRDEDRRVSQSMRLSLRAKSWSCGRLSQAGIKHYFNQTGMLWLRLGSTDPML